MLTKIAPFIFVLLWSTGFIGAKFGLPFAGPATFLAIRMVFNVAVFALLIAWLKPVLPHGKERLHAMVSGGFIHVSYLGGVFAAINFGMPTGLSSLLVGLQPVLTALILVSTTSERLKVSQWTGLFTGILGIALVVQGKTAWAPDADPFYAYLCTTIALAGITLGTLYQKKYCHNQDLLGCATWQYLAAAIIFLPIAYFSEAMAVEWTTTFILAMAWSVLALSVVAILLLLLMVKKGAASKVTSVFYLVPPITAVQGWLFFDESFTSLGVGGFLLAALAVYLVMKAPNWARSPK